MGHQESVEPPHPGTAAHGGSGPPRHPTGRYRTELLASVMEGSDIATAVFDTELRLVMANRKLRATSDRGGALDPGRTLYDLLCRIGYDEETADLGVRAARRVLADGANLTRVLSRPDHTAPRTLHRQAGWYRLEADDGTVLGVAVDFTDTTEREQARAEARTARQRLVLIDESSRSIGTTLDLDRTCGELADIFVPALADFAVVDVLTGLTEGEPRSSRTSADGRMAVRRSAVRHSGELAARLREVVAQQGERFEHPEGSPFVRCLTTNKPLLFPELAEVDAGVLARRAEGVRILGSGDFRSMLVVPLYARSAALGVLIVARTAGWPRFGEDDLTLAAELAARAAVSVDNARAYARERRTALTLQRDLLPHVRGDLPGVRPAHRYLPSGDSDGPAGGDWLDVLQLPDVKVALVVGDAMGRGVGSTALMGQLRTSLRALLFLGLPPDEALWNLDRLTSESGRPELATCLVAVYDPVSGRCSVASAGHPPPLLVAPDGTATYVDVPPGAPLGVGGVPFDVVDIDPPEGSLLVLYTDGLLQDGVGSADPTVGMGRLRDVLRGDSAVASADVEAVCDLVMDHMTSGTDQRDDVALVAARVHTLPDGTVAEWPLEPEPQAAGRARRLVREQLTAWGLDSLAETTELLVSELLTNAVRHGTPPLCVRMLRLDCLRFEVADGGHLLPHLRLAAESDEGGRGVRIVSLLASRWGAHRTAVGKTVWFEQDLDPACDAEGRLAEALLGDALTGELEAVGEAAAGPA